MMEPVLKQLKSNVGDKATVLKMDVDKSQQYASRYGVQAVPTIIIFKDGKILWRKSGVASVNELLQQLEGQFV